MLFTYSNMIAMYEDFLIVMNLVLMLIACTSIQPTEPPIEYELLDDDDDNDISVLPAERSDRGESLASKLKKRLTSMIQIKKGLTIDSGAADHVMPLGWLAWIMVVASAGSLRGLHYVAASGTRIPNKGQQTVRFLTQNGTWAQWIFQVAAINKPLVSVSKLIDDGWRIVFDEEASYLKHKKTGNMISIRRERGVFVVDAFVEPGNPKRAKGQVFTRPT